MDTASLSLRLSVSKYEPSLTRGVGAAAGAGDGEGRRNVLKESLCNGRERVSTGPPPPPSPESGREGGTGAGEAGLLEGREKNDWGLRECIAGGYLRKFVLLLLLLLMSMFLTWSTAAGSRDESRNGLCGDGIYPMEYLQFKTM